MGLSSNRTGVLMKRGHSDTDTEGEEPMRVGDKLPPGKKVPGTDTCLAFRGRLALLTP